MSGKKVFVDTNLFVYLIEENGQYMDQIGRLLRFLSEEKYTIVTSTLTLGEILTKPYRDNRIDLVERYKVFFSGLELIGLNSEIAAMFARIRADYGFKTPDAIQLATAVYGECELFTTNDERLGKFQECKVLLLREFRG